MSLNLNKLYQLLEEKGSASDTYHDIDGEPEQHGISQVTHKFHQSRATEPNTLKNESGLPSAQMERHNRPNDDRFVPKHIKTF